MNPASMPPMGHAVGRALLDGVLASALSIGVLMWRGRIDSRSAAAPLNAVSHLLWPRRALHEDDASLKYTGTGVAVHSGAAMVWAGLYGWMRRRRRTPTPVNAVTDAAAVAAISALVDLQLVPKRLSPGFEERLTRQSLVMTYGGMALGLAVGGLLALNRR